MSDIHPRLAAALEELFGIPAEDLRPEAELEGDLQLDSLAIVELQVVLEEAFEVRITAEDPAALQTLADLQRELDAALERAEPAMPTLRLTEEAS
jgi:acyl carrier protein